LDIEWLMTLVTSATGLRPRKAYPNSLESGNRLATEQCRKSAKLIPEKTFIIGPSFCGTFATVKIGYGKE
jgi:hypothetical protein